MKTRHDRLLTVVLAAAMSGVAGVACFAQTNSTNIATLPARSFLGIGGVTTTPARTASQHFSGREIPQPPRQNSPWTPPVSSLPTNHLTATAILFEQGMADPRSCEYREIEIGTGEVWQGDGGIVKTHGWLLPGKGAERFAVCWNGLVYPVVAFGAPADLGTDVHAAARKTGRTWRNALPEGFTVSYETCLPIKGCLLLRLGEQDLAKVMWAAVQFGRQKGFDTASGATAPELKAVKLNDADPYLDWASDWAWGLFERAVCAHMRGDDGLALGSVRLLSSARQKIETEAEHRGFKRPQNWNGKNTNYLDFLDPLSALAADQERRAQKAGQAVPLTEITKMPNQAARIGALVDQLDQIAVRQMGQPGGLGGWGGPIVAAWRAEGAFAVEPLLKCLESDSANRLTRSVSFGRDFHRGRQLHPVSEPIVSILHEVLGAGNFGAWATTNELVKAGTNGNRITATQISAWMRKFKGSTQEERWYITLLDDLGGMDLWMEAAGSITMPIRSGTVTNATILQGESLRGKNNPSVTELLEKRVRQTTPTGVDYYNGSRAASFALTFGQWDYKAALPILRWQMDFARKASDSTEYSFLNYGQAQYVEIILSHTLARMQYGDTDGIRDYANWLQSRQPGQAFVDRRSRYSAGLERIDQLKPAWMFPDVPVITSALEKLLNDPSSAWSPSRVGTNGTIGLAAQLVSTPLLARPVARQYMLTGLKEKAGAGLIFFGGSAFRTNDISVECKFDVNWGSSQTVPHSDKLPTDTKTPMPFRVCDLFAEQLASVDGFPPFAIYWSLKERDNAIDAIAKFIEENGSKLAELAEQKRKREWWKNK